MKRARRTLTPTEKIHSDWLGMLQPEGLVVSIPVLVEAEAWGRQGPEVQARLRGLAPEGLLSREAFGRLLVEVLGWSPGRLREDVAAWRVPMADLGVDLAPDLALVDRAGRAAVLIRWSGDGEGRRLAQDQPEPGSRFPLSRQAAFERLLTELQRGGEGTAIGVHAGPEAIRLCYAPRGEAPGALTFPVEAMLTRDGRVLLDALVMLLGQDRLWNVPAERRLPALLRQSRQRQEEVTGALAGQVKEALRLLVNGFNVADQRLRGSLLADWRGAGDAAEEARQRTVLREGFTSVILRLVFLMYCEDARDSAGRAILPVDNALYQEGYSLGALADRLAADRARYQEAMSSRFGAWARICALFRLIFNGVRHQSLQLPARQGELFDPGRFPFLEGRGAAGSWTTDRADVPPVDDGVVDGVLENLVFLEGQRVSYRNLDVEQLGSVYEALMELDLQRANEELLREDGVVRAGALYLEAGAERRNTGSHYTPPTLTAPIVARTLGPLLGSAPSSKQILALKICDPAMGSGAFLSEACRYLGQRLLEAWQREDHTPPEAHTDPLLVARRMVAERCLYGVDKNPFAVNLARLSLWLVTLARDLPFTFVDHALACGDAVIGLNSRQIQAMSLDDKGNAQMSFGMTRVLQSAARAREKILSPDLFTWRQKHTLLLSAKEDVAVERQIGDALLAAAWLGGTAKQQKERAARLKDDTFRWQSSGDETPPTSLRDLIAALPMRPFHWELEFPEVFLKRDGFDAIIGNPPFGGQETIRQANGGAPYIKLLQALRPHAHGNSDLCAHFFLRAASILQKNGCFGLVATNTIKQGDTRQTGLKHLIEEKGIVLYDALTDQPWVGGAAVYVDIVHGRKGASPTGKVLNSMLQEEEEQTEPVALKEREDQAFMGVKIYGQGFVLTPEETVDLINQNPHNAKIIRPYIGGEEVNSNQPDQDGFVLFDRYVIDFGDRSLEEAEQWPELVQILREKVKPERDLNSRDAYRINWWKFAESRPGMNKMLLSITIEQSNRIESNRIESNRIESNRIESNRIESNLSRNKHIVNKISHNITSQQTPHHRISENGSAVLRSAHHLRALRLHLLRHPPIFRTRSLGASLRPVLHNEDRHPLHPQHLLRDLPLPPSGRSAAGQDGSDRRSLPPHPRRDAAATQPGLDKTVEPRGRSGEWGRGHPAAPVVESGHGSGGAGRLWLVGHRRRRQQGDHPAAPVAQRGAGKGAVAPPRCIVNSLVSKHLIFAFQPTDRVFSHKLNVVALWGDASFAILQSKAHEAWARSLSSTMKTDLNYTPSTCFETFPFPALTPERRRELDSIGEAFHLYRAQLQRDRGLGLTKLWNLVVDPANGDADIEMLRGLKAEMDRAVLDAYGWPEVDPGDSREIVRRLRRLNGERARGG